MSCAIGRRHTCRQSAAPSHATRPQSADNLSGKIFVVSGVFEKFSRDDLKKSIEDNGGKVGSSISAKTDYVVAGDNMGPAKLEKANKLNVPIISEDDFMKLINEN